MKFQKVCLILLLIFIASACDNASTKKAVDADIVQNDGSDNSLSADIDNTVDNASADKDAPSINDQTASDLDNNNVDTVTVSDEDTEVTGDDDNGVVLDNFSFFATSLKAIQQLSGSQNGFGGDLRYGETGAGAGLRGADKICSAIAEISMPGSSKKQWRAFLSVTKDETGKQVNAIDRIGEGPWYDRLGRLFAPNKAALLYTRPQNGDTAIRDDFPNEDGVPNHRPDTTQAAVDNHDFITGSNKLGQLYSATATCSDWTSTATNIGKPRVGHSWPRTGPLAMLSETPPPGTEDMANWMSALDESGCKAGINLIETGAPGNDGNIGSGGGYGGFYCFALQP